MSQQPPYGQQPQQPGWGAPQPPAPPKKTSVGKIVGFGCLGVVGLVVVLAVAGALIGDKSTDKTATPPAASAPGAPSVPAKAPASEAAPAPKGAEADVKITGCGVDAVTKWAKAEVTITNGSSKTSNYLVNVEFVNASGTRVGEAFAASNNLAPGQAAEETAQGLDQIKDKITCKVTKVTRYAS